MIYHASRAQGPKEYLVSGGFKIVALVPDGEDGIRLKPWVLSNIWYAETFGRTLDVLSIFNES